MSMPGVALMADVKSFLSDFVSKVKGETVDETIFLLSFARGAHIMEDDSFM